MALEQERESFPQESRKYVCGGGGRVTLFFCCGGGAAGVFMWFYQKKENKFQGGKKKYIYPQYIHALLHLFVLLKIAWICMNKDCSRDIKCAMPWLPLCLPMFMADNTHSLPVHPSLLFIDPRCCQQSN